MRIKIQYVLIPILLFVTACSQTETVQVEGKWIKGNPLKQINTIEKQFRGFDMAMVETGYRYQELYWAGQDENWDYANYQINKIEKAIKNGLERRPKRAQSAQHFLSVVLPELQKSIANRDALQFKEKFNTLTINCNACHLMERVPFFTVKTPLERQSPIR